jgi:hypothetical protein
MTLADGKLLTLDLTLRLWGVTVAVAGTVEILDVRRDL